MTSVTLTDPTNGTTTDANLIANNNSALEAVINGGLDNSNISGSAAIAVSKLAAGTNGQVLSVSGGVPTYVTPSWTTRYRKVTEKDVANTVTTTDLLNGEITVGANVMGTNGILRANLFGDLLYNATLQFTLSLKFGGTTVWSDTVGSANSATRRGWVIELYIVNQNATNVQAIGGYVDIGNLTTEAATTGLGGLTGSYADVDRIPISNRSLAIDTTASCALVAEITWSGASASASMRLLGAIVEVL